MQWKVTALAALGNDCSCVAGMYSFRILYPSFPYMFLYKFLPQSNYNASFWTRLKEQVYTHLFQVQKSELETNLLPYAKDTLAQSWITNL